MPGTSGILSPFGKIEGLYFNNSSEPDDFTFDFKKDIKNIMDKDGVEYLEINCDNKKDYYKILNALVDFNEDSITVSGTSKDNFKIIVENSEDADSDENDTDDDALDDENL